MNRRHFVMSTAVAAGAKLARGANDTIRVAAVGIRGRGRSHIQAFGNMPGVELAALCDIDESVLQTRLNEVEKTGKKRPQGYTDFRKLLEDKSIDAISIATQNHNHTLQTVWACQAGKDVYVEKPCSHNIFEARQVVAAARKYNRIVQHGTQSRSSPVLREAETKLREGVIGDLYMARGLCFKWRDTIGREPDTATPAGVHYDLWLGPAPVRAFNKNRFHYNWHWNWDYGNGDIGNQGIHEMDKARWGLGVKYPVKVSSMGGHYMFDDDQQTPNTQVALFEFNGAAKRKFLVFEVRHWMSNHEGQIGERGRRKDSNTVGNIFYGSKGYMVWDGGQSHVYLGREQELQPGDKVERPDGEGGHFGNFIQAMRSRKREELAADIEEGATSTVLVHLANISYRLGRSINFDSDNMTCPGDKEATSMFTRKYRSGFVVPEKV